MLRRTPEEQFKGDAPMEETLEIEIEKESEDVRVYAWRVEQLAKLGLSTVIAYAVANFVDWHEVARLVQKGCPPELALDIAR
jgi:hypothetical protein